MPTKCRLVWAAATADTLPLGAIQKEPAVTSDRATSKTDQDQSAAQLLSLVYAQLRALAQRNLDGERPGHTLTATLV